MSLALDQLTTVESTWIVGCLATQSRIRSLWLSFNTSSVLQIPFSQHTYLLVVYLLLQVEESSPGEESLLSSSMSSGRSVSSFCSYRKQHMEVSQ